MSTTDLWPTSQVAVHHGVTASSVQKWVKAGQLVPARTGGQGKGPALFDPATVIAFTPPPVGRRKKPPEGPTPEQVNDALMWMTNDVRQWHLPDLAHLFHQAGLLGLLPRSRQRSWTFGEIYGLLELMVGAMFDPRIRHAYHMELVSVKFLHCLGRRAPRIARELALTQILILRYLGDWEMNINLASEPGTVTVDERVMDRILAMAEPRWSGQWEAAAKAIDPAAVRLSQRRHKTLSPGEIARARGAPTYRDDPGEDKSHLGQDAPTARDTAGAAIAARRIKFGIK